MHTNPLRERALWLASHGWHVFPLVPRTKRPAIKAWEQRATTERSRIIRCWNHAAYNIGLACGPSELVVLDLDTVAPGEAPPEGWNMVGISGGGDVLAELARRADSPVPATFTVATPSGGWHLYYRTPASGQLRNTTGKLGWKIDTRAHGGYVLAPGSTLAEGGYELVDEDDPVHLPGWLARLLAPRSALDPVAAAVERRPGYLQAALAGETDRVRAAQPGQHNKTVFIAACALGQLVAGDALVPDEARAVLQRAAEPLVNGSCRCTATEIANTIDSGLKAGASRPRRIHGGHAA